MDFYRVKAYGPKRLYIDVKKIVLLNYIGKINIDIKMTAVAM